jgi:N-acyl homoserine lactone hydrolase
MYKITAIDYGFQMYPESFVLSGASLKSWVRVELYLFVLQSESINILIDVGMSKVHADESNPFITSNIGEPGKFIIEENPLDQLKKKLDLDINDIDFIFITHFHLDHVCNLPYFNKPKIIVSRKNFSEVVAPRHPEMVPKVIFPREAITFLVGKANDRLILIDDHQKILPGIDMFSTGGHTIGHQSIIVETINGKYYFPVDNVPFFRNLEQGIPVGNPANVSESLDAIKFAQKFDGNVIVPHDPKLKEIFPNGRIV